MSKTLKITLIRKNVIVGAHVEATMDVGYWDYDQADPESLGKCLERKCKDFEDFLRDHRSQDMISLEVVRETQNQCAACNAEWEADEYDGAVHCANCGAILQTNPK